jgi:hypothetical protein
MRQSGDRKVATAKEFVEFWLKNSVHPDEQSGPKRGSQAVQHLADTLIAAGAAEGFTKAQIEAEIGDIYEFIRTSIDKQNVAETKRLDKESP